MATELVVARGRVLGTLTKLKTYCGSINIGTPAAAIEIRLGKLEDLWNEFNAIEDKLMCYTVDEEPVHESKCEYFTDRYFDVKSILLQSLREKQSTPRHTHDDTRPMDNLLDQQRLFFEGLLDRTNELNKSINHHQQESPRLPRISIDPFSGDYSTWPSFHDLYKSTVHSNPSLSNIHKFQILKGLLKDDAASLIRHFLVTDANYTEAWEKLVKRYDKKRPILKTHIVKFFDQASASNGSVVSLRRISDVSDEIIRGIKALGTEAENRDPWLIYILLNKVDEETRELWASKTLDKEFPTIYEFLEFLNDRCDAKESSTIDTKRKSTKPIEHVKSLLISTDAETEKCPCCKRSHSLHRCLNFKGMSVIKRRRMVNIYMVCYNCLRVGHTVDKCSVEKSCKICKHRHHSMLHLETPSPQNISVEPSTSEAHTSSTQLHTAQNIVHNESTEEVQSLNANTSRFALLPTALVFIRDNAGKMHKARALLDSGSQSTFVSEGLVQKLNLKRSFSNVKVTGIAETNATVARGLVNIFIQSIHDKEEHVNVKALILSKVTSTIPPAKVETKCIEQLKDLQLADPNFHNPARIDLLIGADIFFKTLKPNQIAINDNIIAQSTKFGWIVTGSTRNTKQIQSFTTITSEDSIYKLLENFWALENVPNMPTPSEVENECEKHFIENTIRNPDGRYVVRLPFNSDIRPLGSSRSAAVTRLLAMERRFQSKSSLHEQYNNFMNEYLQLNHMQEVNSEQINGEDQQCYYLPHHAVFKTDSTTTKLRVVFDGSCKSTTGVSLNEKLLVGPTIQRDLVSIILKFRTHAIAFSADVEKMYRQVEVNEKDTKYQKIVWRNSPTQSIKEYELRTVTYGTSCAPFLAVRVLHQIAADYKHIFPEGAAMATTDFYIDDLLSGRNNIEEAKSVYDEITQMLMKGGFILRKWKSNSPEFMKKIPKEYIETSNLDLHDDQERVKTLGLYWNPTRDTFSYNIHAVVAQIFDP